MSLVYKDGKDFSYFLEQEHPPKTIYEDVAIEMGGETYQWVHHLIESNDGLTYTTGIEKKCLIATREQFTDLLRRRNNDRSE